jgi:hypothetical protein
MTETAPESTQASTDGQKGVTSDTHPVPALGAGFQETHSPAELESAEATSGDETPETIQPGSEPKPKRRLFGFVKKKTKDEPKDKLKKPSEGLSEKSASTLKSSDTPKHHPANLNFHPPTHPYSSQSPTRGLHSSSSPRVISPAGSQIFERDVQETASLAPTSPAIPAHIQTEDHIPAVLDASSEAITDRALDPDTVEIVMHASHQPAAASVSGLGSSEVVPHEWSGEALGGGHYMQDRDEGDRASVYAALDNPDVRRLSFISFADVVQSEHAEHAAHPGANSAMGMGPPSIAGLAALPSPGQRSPSPIRSAMSSPGVGTSPPTSKSASVKGVEVSPSRAGRPLASPLAGAGASGVGSEVLIETMSQALRKTASGELAGGGVVSQPLSPVVGETKGSGTGI